MNNVIIKLKEPFWGAWKKYGWVERTPGFGLAVTELRKARDKKVDVEVVYKDKKYIQSIDALLLYIGQTGRRTKFMARGTMLYVFPQSLFKEEDL